MRLSEGTQTVQSGIGISGTASTSAGRGAGRGVFGPVGRGQGGGRGQSSQGGGRGQIGQSSSAGGGQARVYHLTREEGQTSSAAVTGTLSVSGTSAYVLFDSGASHSFITSYFIEHARLVSYPLI